MPDRLLFVFSRHLVSPFLRHLPSPCVHLRTRLTTFGPKILSHISTGHVHPSLLDFWWKWWHTCRCRQNWNSLGIRPSDQWLLQGTFPFFQFFSFFCRFPFSFCFPYLSFFFFPCFCLFFLVFPFFFIFPFFLLSFSLFSLCLSLLSLSSLLSSLSQCYKYSSLFSRFSPLAVPSRVAPQGGSPNSQGNNAHPEKVCSSPREKSEPPGQLS